MAISLSTYHPLTCLWCLGASQAFRSNVVRHAAKRLLLFRALKKRSQTLLKTAVAAWLEYRAMVAAKLSQLKRAYQHCEKFILMKPAMDAWVAYMDRLHEQEEERMERAMALRAKLRQSWLKRILYAWACCALLDSVSSSSAALYPLLSYHTHTHTHTHTHAHSRKKRSALM